MCGIAGFLDLMGTIEDPVHALTRMADRLVHRGPDDSGTWWSAPLRVGLAHRRLAILDVSPAGHQPMSSACGRWCVAFNGEAYRFREMRAELDSRRRTRWRGHSDTEVIVECLAEDGFERTIRRLSGMCAIAAVDVREGRLWLASDRAGKKPLYYGWTAGVFAFASELKALRALGPMPAVDDDAVAMMLRYGYVPAPSSIYRGVSKLRPGSLVSLALRDGRGIERPACRTYWTVGELAASKVAQRLNGSGDLTELEGLLFAAVRRRMVSDVPVGAFLSGGVDSSLVCALMVRAATSKVRTFSVGFEDDRLDESRYAERVASFLGTEHSSIRVSESDVLGVVPLISDVYDEPFADSSQIPTFLVSKLARQYVTVALSGDGGDEVFGGYARYRAAVASWGRIGLLPGWLRCASTRCVRVAGPGIRFADKRLGLSRHLPLGPMRALLRSPTIVATLLSQRDFATFYKHIVSSWSSPPVLRIGQSGSTADQVLDSGLDVASLGPRSWMMATDFQTYLCGDILAKVDRASMANSLEVRCPFLDAEVVEFAWGLPDECRVGSNGLKVALQDLARRLVPPEVVDRPKMGFGVPLAQWLRGPLHTWMQDLLAKDSLARDGVLDPLPIQASVAALLAGDDSEQGRVWSAAVLSAWLRHARTC